MKSSWQSIIWIAIGLVSGPVAVSAVWLLAAIAAEAGFVVLPDSAPRFYGPKGREEDITEIIATRDQTGGLLGLFRQTVAPKVDQRRTSIKRRTNSFTS